MGSKAEAHQRPVLLRLLPEMAFWFILGVPASQSRNHRELSLMPLRGGLPAGLCLSVLLGGNPAWAPDSDKEAEPALKPADPHSRPMDSYRCLYVREGKVKESCLALGEEHGEVCDGTYFFREFIL